MKIRPILIISAIVILLVGGIVYFVHSRNAAGAPDKSGIVQFLNRFNKSIKEGNLDSLSSCFETGSKKRGVKRLVLLLAGKNDLSGLQKPYFDFSLNINMVEIKLVKGNLAEAAIPATFTHDSVSTLKTMLNLKIRKVGLQDYKIVQVENSGFIADYEKYENLVKNKTGADKDMYSAITLAAFKTADQLKTRYDSVVWFAHLNNKTWFYVTKGPWHEGGGIYTKRDSTNDSCKMGLVNPDLKEVIPFEYNIIHNINGTFDGLIEVEKGSKRGFYNLSGKLVIPVSYDQIYPIDDETNMAVLKSGDDYFYLKKDTTISAKVDLKLSDFFPKITGIAGSFNLKKNALSVITEYNSRDELGAVYIPPSYLVDMNIAPAIEDYKNPLRKGEYDEVSENYEVSGDEKVSQNWFQAAFYSIRDYFLGGRSEFYDRKNLVIVDKKTDRVFATDIGLDYTEDGQQALDGPCNVNSIRQLNDSLFEVRGGASLFVALYDSTKSISGGPYYHYLVIRGNKLVELPNIRTFGFTKYVKMDDSYLVGCYNISTVTGYNQSTPSTLDHVTPEMLRYMKNEIFADYRYQFKDKRWQDVFGEMDSYNNRSGQDNRPNNVNVDDSLTVIDKYNINWITQKLKGGGTKPNSLAYK
jgi:hypothetical protein